MKLNWKRKNELSLPIGMEGGEALENKIENLEYFINKGLFILALRESFT